MCTLADDTIHGHLTTSETNADIQGFTLIFSVKHALAHTLWNNGTL